MTTLKKRSLSDALGRTLDELAARRIITPHFEKTLLTGDWPEEYQIRVHNKEHVYDGYYHPSSDSYRGEMELFYRHHPAYRPGLVLDRGTPEMEIAAQIGSAMHAMIQSLWVHAGFASLEDCEVSFVNEKRWVSGSIDVGRFVCTSGTFPVEIKTKYQVPKEPVDKHVAQFQVYMDAGCTEAYGEPQEQGILFYMSRSAPHRMTEFLIRRDEDLLNTIYSKWAKVREAIAADDPSELRDCCMPNSATHKGCPARDICRIGAPTYG